MTDTVVIIEPSVQTLSVDGSEAVSIRQESVQVVSVGVQGPPGAQGIQGIGADTSLLVPYTGATGTVNLGANNFIVDTNIIYANATNNVVGIGLVPNTTGSVLQALSTGSAGQFRAYYNSSNYYALRCLSTGRTYHNAQGSNPAHEFQINGSPTFMIENGYANMQGSTPRYTLSGADCGAYFAAGYFETYESGLYGMGSDEKIATYDSDTGMYIYGNGQLQIGGQVNVPYGGMTVTGMFEQYHTGEDMRIGYNGGNYLKVQVSSTGTVAFDAVGTSPKFTFADLVELTAGQLKFPASQVASSNANTLDDYEEGTWTPVYSYVTPGDLSVTYSQQIGTYTKIGNLVTISGRLVTSTHTHSTASGAQQIGGQPFAAMTLANHRWVGSVGLNGVTKTGYTQLTTRIDSGASQITLEAWASGSSSSSVLAADCPSGTTQIRNFTTTYQTAT